MHAEFSTMFRDVLEKLNIDVDSLAQKAGLSRNIFYKYLRGQSLPREVKMKKNSHLQNAQDMLRKAKIDYEMIRGDDFYWVCLSGPGNIIFSFDLDGNLKKVRASPQK